MDLARFASKPWHIRLCRLAARSPQARPRLPCSSYVGSNLVSPEIFAYPGANPETCPLLLDCVSGLNPSRTLHARDQRLACSGTSPGSTRRPTYHRPLIAALQRRNTMSPVRLGYL